MQNNSLVINQLTDILLKSKVSISEMLPSEWVEANIIMKQPHPGPYRYDVTPYWREPIDCLSEDHPARWITIMKGQQIGASSGVIITGLAWIIANSPADTWFTVGSAKLVKASGLKLDKVLYSAGLKKLIESQSHRNNKSGDTDEKKEFLNGSIMFGTLENHNDIADFSVKVGFHDDYDRNKSVSNEAGATDDLLQGRYNSYSTSHKIFKISTPKTKKNSQIEPAFLRGDQRKYLIPCTECHEHIELLWSHDSGGGMHFETKNGLLIPSSVGYICPLCGGFFTDMRKGQQLIDGFWKPTAEPKRKGDYSYHINCLYSPSWMVSWAEYVSQYLDANPENQDRNEAKHQTFQNVVLGLTYEEDADQLSSLAIQKNIGGYEPGIVPENLSIRDGNGKIVLLTLGSDLNGIENDVRLDWEIVAHSENGATYSVDHGSIGTFFRGDKENSDRIKWTAMNNGINCIWPELDKLISKAWQGDNELLYDIAIGGVDVSYSYTDVYQYLSSTPHFRKMVGLRGSKEKEYLRRDVNTKLFQLGASRKDEYLIQVGYFKDDLSVYMNLRRQPGHDQPANFMNFPEPSGGRYTYPSYFEHYESEQRQYVTAKNGTVAFRWEKKNSKVNNHFWDCRVYNLALREIFISIIGSQLGEKVFIWSDFVGYVNKLV